jgi:CheY-like chemotaxis protein
MNGEIFAGKAPEGGALFTIRVPAASAPAREAGEDDGDGGVVRGKRILVVDDEEKVRKLLARTLVLDQHDVTTVAGVQEALASMEFDEFDLILSDLRMPDATGLDLYRRIRERDPEAALRMVFFTGSTLSQEYAEFFDRTGAVLIRKPFKLDDVRAKIRVALERSAVLSPSS